MKAMNNNVQAMSSAGFRSTYLSAYNQFLYFTQIYQFITNPRIAYLAIVVGRIFYFSTKLIFVKLSMNLVFSSSFR
jgi:hypothetical protein